MALLEHITCEVTIISAPSDNVEETINKLSLTNLKANKTGFQLQFEVS